MWWHRWFDYSNHSAQQNLAQWQTEYFVQIANNCFWRHQPMTSTVWSDMQAWMFRITLRFLLNVVYILSSNRHHRLWQQSLSNKSALQIFTVSKFYYDVLQLCCAEPPMVFHNPVNLTIIMLRMFIVRCNNDCLQLVAMMINNGVVCWILCDPWYHFGTSLFPHLFQARPCPVLNFIPADCPVQFAANAVDSIEFPVAPGVILCLAFFSNTAHAKAWR